MTEGSFEFLKSRCPIEGFWQQWVFDKCHRKYKICESTFIFHGGLYFESFQREISKLGKILGIFASIDPCSEGGYNFFSFTSKAP